MSGDVGGAIGGAMTSGIGSDRSVVVRLALAADSYITGLGAAGASTKAFVNQLDGAAKTGQKGMAELSRGAAYTGVAFLALGGYAVKSFAEFDAAMSNVKANATATESEFGALRQAAIDAGNATKYSATEAAEAENELAKAGFHANQIIAALPGVLALAAAGQVGLAEATAITASTLKQFGLGAEQAGHVADVLAAGADRSLADVTSLGEALRYTAPTADALGVSLEETVGSLALFADQGMQGSIAGTTLNDVLLRMIPRSKKAGEQMEDLGLNFFNAKGEFIGIAAAAQQLSDKMGHLTDKQRLGDFKTIFGVEGMRGAKYLFEQGAKGVDSYTDAVDTAGFAAKNAATKTDNLKGDVEKLTSAIDTGFIQAGSGANGALRLMAQGGIRVADVFSTLPTSMQQTVMWTGSLSGAVLAAGGAYGTMAPKIRTARQALVDMGTTGARANAVLGKVGKTVGVATAAFIALELVAAGVTSVSDQMIGAVPSVEEFTAALQMLAATGNSGGLDKIGVSLNDLQEDLRRLARRSGEEKFGDVMQRIFSANMLPDVKAVREARKHFEAVDAALAEMVNSGHAKDAAAAIDMIGLSASESKKLLPGYTGAVQAAANAAAESVPGNKDAAAALGAAAKSATEAAQAVKAYSDALKAMTPEGALLQDTIALNKAMAEARTEFRDMGTAALDHKGNLDLTKKSGQEAATTLLAVAQAARTVAADMREAGASEEQANAKLEQGRAAFIKLATGIGMGTTAAQELADSLGLVPFLTVASIETPGAKKSTQDTKDLNAEIKRLKNKEARLRLLGTPEAIRQANATRRAINAIQSRRITIEVHRTLTGVSDSVANLAAGLTMKRGRSQADGGINLRSAADGHLPRNATIMPPGDALYQWRERETAGEAFIPLADSKRGRSKQIAEDVVGMFGGTVAWSSGGMSAASVTSSAGGGGRAAYAELSPRATAAITALAGRVVQVELRVDSEVLARANTAGQRKISHRG